MKADPIHTIHTIRCGGRDELLGTVTELMELVALARGGKIRVDVERFALDQAPEVSMRLRRGEIRGPRRHSPKR